MKKTLTGERPSIPDSCGKYMQGLIPRCWSMIPENRPSFEDIFMEFQGVEFNIIPQASAFHIREYVCGVLAWEGQAAASHRKMNI
jgi:hypothetical protein